MGEAGARSLNVASKSPAGTGTERTAARGLNRRWAATLLLLAVLALIDYWLVAAGIERVRAEVVAADDAASQRILFQRTVFLGGMLSNGKLAPRNRSTGHPRARHHDRRADCATTMLSRAPAPGPASRATARSCARSTSPHRSSSTAVCAQP
jgi:hypothetical protein